MNKQYNNNISIPLDSILAATLPDYHIKPKLKCHHNIYYSRQKIWESTLNPVQDTQIAIVQIMTLFSSYLSCFFVVVVVGGVGGAVDFIEYRTREKRKTLHDIWDVWAIFPCWLFVVVVACGVIVFAGNIAKISNCDFGKQTFLSVANLKSLAYALEI